MSKDHDFHRLSQVDLAAAFDVTPRAVRDWDECPRNDDGTYHLAAVIAWRMQDGALDLNAERARLAKEQADKTALDNAVKRGELLSVQTVATEWGRMIGSARAKLLGLPSQAAQQLSAMKNAIAIRDHLTRKISDALAELSEYRPGDGSADDTQADQSGGEDMDAAAQLDSQPVGRRQKVPKQRK